MRRWESEEVGRPEDGKVRRWEDLKTGKREDGKAGGIT